MTNDERRSKDIDEAIATLQYEVLDFKTKMELPLSALSDITDKQTSLMEGLSLLDKSISKKLDYLKSREKGIVIPEKSYRELVLNLEILNRRIETIEQRFIREDKKDNSSSYALLNKESYSSDAEQVKIKTVEVEDNLPELQIEKVFPPYKYLLSISLPLVIIIFILSIYILIKV